MKFDNVWLSNVINFISKYKRNLIISSIILFSFIISICLIVSLNNNKYKGIVIELRGDDVVTIYRGDDYIESGYDAYNSKNKNLNDKVLINSNLNTKKVGEYQITYAIDDIKKVRKVVVIDKPKEYTYIYLNSIDNNVDVYLNIGDEYIEPGYHVYSNSSDDLNNNVKIYGSVDTNKKGNYKLIYSVVDSSGITVSKTRMVYVIDTEIELSLSNNNLTREDIFIKVLVNDNLFDYMVLPDGRKINDKNYSYRVSSNGKFTFKVYNTKGREKEKVIEVSNIDKVSPTGSCWGYYKNGVSYINVNANDNIGIKNYLIDGNYYTDKNIKINREISKVNIRIYDKVGNYKDINCNLKDETPKTYYEREFSVNNFSLKNGLDLAYWLYIPEGATDNMPLVIYLHGTEGKGNDFKYNTKLAITYGPGSDIYHNRREFNSIILMPQARYKQNMYGDELMELVEYIVNKYKINEKKISIVGMSEGGYHLATYVGNYADYFSTVVFLATYPYYPEKFLNIPVITVCGEQDYERIYTMIWFSKEINQLGGNARHYTLPGLGHTIVDNDGYSVFRDEEYDLVEWMSKQTRK